MRSQLAVRLGSLEPTILHEPPDVHSLAAAEEAIELADAYGICDGNPLAESQKITLRGAMAERADGTWAASRVGDFGPRQGTGKNDKIGARELAGLVLLGEQLIIHTAHEFPTANEAFLRLVAIFENYDDLRSKVRRVLYGNGTQSINLRSGQRILYKARTGGSARGFTKADLVVYDEAQHLVGSHVAASAPAKLANPNSQSWFAGSGGFATSQKAWEMRRQAIFGTGGRLAYTEMTAETIEVKGGKIVCHAPDPLDVDAWYRSMPGLGRWITEESMRALYDELGAEDFAREGMCVWDPEPVNLTQGDIDIDDWHDLADTTAKRGERLSFGVDVDIDRLTHIAVAWRRPDGLVHVALADTGLTPLVAPDRLSELEKAWKGPVVLGGPSLIFEGEVRRSVAMTSADFAEASGRFEDLLSERGLRHADEPALNAAVEAAKWRNYGTSGARTLQLGGSPLVGPLAAVIRAIHGLVLGGAGPVATPVGARARSLAGSSATADLASMQF